MREMCYKQSTYDFIKTTILGWYLGAPLIYDLDPISGQIH